MKTQFTLQILCLRPKVCRHWKGMVIYMKIAKKELIKVSQTMICSFAAAAVYYFVYNIDVDAAHTLGVLCVGCIILHHHKFSSKNKLMHTNQ